MNEKLDVERFEREKNFHDGWAVSEDMKVDPGHVNTAMTSPELRCIHRSLGSVEGKSVLDLGCGLGEASVYFALCGAKVTASDLSPEMLNVTQALAERKGVSVQTHLAVAEDLGIASDVRFDIVYVGNLFHHVDLAVTLDRLLPHIAEDGVLVSWDPLAYNPVINLYRLIATEVRTEDEHPLRRCDVKEIRDRFEVSQASFFWFSTLLVFILMVLVQFKNPNKVRFWKAVVDDSEKWEWLYRPLEKLDSFLLRIIPGLGWLCWNVVIIARKPKR